MLDVPFHQKTAVSLQFAAGGSFSGSNLRCAVLKNWFCGAGCGFAVLGVVQFQRNEARTGTALIESVVWCDINSSFSRSTPFLS